MEQQTVPSEYQGWWRITETSQWSAKYLDMLGPALISFAGRGGQVRMHALLAYVTYKPTQAGVSFTWEGAWEFDPVAGSGRVKLGKDGHLRGVIKIKGGDESRFTASRSAVPDQPIPPPPDYRDKWRRR